MKRYFIDLCSGLGGAHAAMLNRPGWAVIAIDNNPDLLPYAPHTLMCDVNDTTATITLINEALALDGYNPAIDELIFWASPPCGPFSNAFHAPGPTARREGKDYHPREGLAMVEACLEIIHHFTPTWWFVENVRGACPWFMPILGKHTTFCGSFFLWGQFPALSFDDRAQEHKKSDNDPGNHPLRSNFRAKLPPSVSSAVAEAIETQSTLRLWITSPRGWV